MSKLGKKPVDLSLEEFQDINTTQKLFGCFMKQPDLLAGANLVQDDFIGLFQQIVFTAIYNLIRDEEAKVLDPDIIDEYLSRRPAKHAVFVGKQGYKYLSDAYELSDLADFERYITIVKKWSMLRELYKRGFDISYYYNPSGITGDTELAIDHFEKATLESMVAHYQTILFTSTSRFTDNVESVEFAAGGDEGRRILESFKISPSWGLNYASQLLNTVTYGIKKSKYSVTTAGTGTGKTRMTIANMCRSFAPSYWDIKEKKWVENSLRAPHGACLYIGTEMDVHQEIFPLLVAYIAGVNSAHVITGAYDDGEEERVFKANDIITEALNDKTGGFFLVNLPNYNYTSLEQYIKKYYINHNVTTVFLDYLHVTENLMIEYKSVAGSAYQRDDQLLLWASSKLKDLAGRLNISIDTWTQANRTIREGDIKDERAVRGSISIIDKVDIGAIMTAPTPQELKKIEPIYTTNGVGKEPPNRVITIYKNRGGALNDVMIWLNFDLGTMRVHDGFVTNREYVPLDVVGTNICTERDGKTVALTKENIDKEHAAGNITDEVYYANRSLRLAPKAILTKESGAAKKAAEAATNMTTEDAKIQIKTESEESMKRIQDSLTRTFETNKPVEDDIPNI